MLSANDIISAVAQGFAFGVGAVAFCVVAALTLDYLEARRIRKGGGK